jgi:uncharacterized iron-regulated membrane protein
MRNLRAVHRAITAIVVVFTLYLGFSGTLIQLIDLRTLFEHAPATDPNMQSIREAFNGPPNFQVIAIADYTAQALSKNENPADMLTTVLKSARSEAGDAPLRFIELRMMDGKPVGQVDAGGGKLLRFDAVNGALLGKFPVVRENQQPDSQRNTVKHLHRMTVFGDWALWINVIVGLGLAVLIVTGAWMYFRLFAPRVRTDRRNPFWSGGGWWRTLHRGISIVAAVFLSVVMLSGFWLAVESLGKALYMARHPVSSAGKPADTWSPLPDEALPAMLRATLGAYEAAVPDVPARAIRLRYFAGMPQGVVISGEEEARQLVFNAETGRRASLTEPGYPPTGFPFGWQAHQLAKSIHRGDFFGLSGRFMDLFAGLSMIYLSISGIALYYDLWSRRRRSGRFGFFWT